MCFCNCEYESSSGCSRGHGPCPMTVERPLELGHETAYVPAEGDSCPKCKEGTLEFKTPENCSCHINPPCSACENTPLACPNCDWTSEDV